ncbi:protein tyrosine phosphatase family protein [Cognatiyoonia sp. IB215446]|uniref:protein tyrosine phosphatase family protein n=1 Tax=Cognatiyoonia sp. IB215446 TaxID=3097355 RepID=UPI002A0E4DE7|nr:protein tyrosine phosphatase family protein [Cognatiyoonia sp. IB215446]MDX8349993.1 protein tyrosine phosphatase family protein [Cognatiyoonia sp. IB215446]
MTKDPEHILNWRRVNAHLTTSGQPDAAQLAEIRDLGVTHIVNLGLGHGKDALPDEADKVAALGMRYTHIPVDFEGPTDQDFANFKAALDNDVGSQIHVHCIYNARVSAFFYRYAKTHDDLPEEEAFAMMESIWRPGDDWADFIGDPAAKGQPNRYAGDDY